LCYNDRSRGFNKNGRVGGFFFFTNKHGGYDNPKPTNVRDYEAEKKGMHQ